MYLGKHIPIHFGGPGNQAKRAVMNEACANKRVRPTFSRMSGIQEWKDAIFLFVNVGLESDNKFLESGQRIIWYAQNRQSEVSSQIQRMIHHATGCKYPHDAKEGEPTVQLAPCSIALICRLEDEPYIWCGELNYVRHNASVHPIEFVWQIQRHTALKGAPLFERLLAVGS